MRDNDKSLCFVVTTINHKSKGIREIEKNLSKNQELIVIGDAKTPSDFNLTNGVYLSVTDQMTLNYPLISKLGLNTYTRKMIGYLLAYKKGFSFIRETDDDNIPYKCFFKSQKNPKITRVLGDFKGFVNVYKFFSQEKIWPRGFPLDMLKNDLAKSKLAANIVDASGLFIFQDLADGDPDVDAIWRLTYDSNSNHIFKRKYPVLIKKGQYAPFNSQATTWPRLLINLMYLPSTCTFRMTDIWRSYIAQHLLYQLGGGVVFRNSSVYQVRNQHDLLQDFNEEISGYLGAEKFVAILSKIKLKHDLNSMNSNMKIVYEELIKNRYFHETEIRLLELWQKSISQIDSDVN